MNFSNPVIGPQNLPQVDALDFIPLEKRYRSMMYLRNIIFLLILSSITIAPFFMDWGEETNMPSMLWAIIPLSIIWIYSLFIVQVGFAQKAFLLRKHDVLYKSGFFNRRQIAVPKNRIQHIELRQSFLARLFGLSKLVVYTAGGNASDLSIPGLNPEVAQQMKEEISQSIKSHE